MLIRPAELTHASEKFEFICKNLGIYNEGNRKILTGNRKRLRNWEPRGGYHRQFGGGGRATFKKDIGNPPSSFFENIVNNFHYTYSFSFSFQKH